MPQLTRVARIAAACAACVGWACAAGCQQKRPPAPPQALDYARELPPGEKALRKIPPSEYPDFSVMQTKAADLARAIDHSLEYLGRPSSRQFFPYMDITHDRAVATLRAVREVLAGRAGAVGDSAGTGLGGGPDWNAQVRQKFEVYQSVGAPAPGGSGYTGQVLFTGYFTPIYDAILTRQGPYQWPLYKRPADLVTVNEGTGASGRRLPDGTVATPYYSRVEIERDGKLAGQEFVWLKSRWEAYVVTVQGSARLRLTDGSGNGRPPRDGRLIDVGYAGTNGYPYVSPGRKMVEEGVLAKDQLSYTTLRRYFEAHPEAMDKYLWLNPRTTFFTETTGRGIPGSLNVPVTAFATIATDKDVYPRAMPAFVAVPVPADAAWRLGPGNDAGRPAGGSTSAETPPGTVPFRGFMLDQDSGGAIRAAGRCDLYMGVGPQAEQWAGRQLYPGRLYYLALRPELVPRYLGMAARAGDP